MKILVPIDGSENATRAVEYALNITKKHSSARVTLLAVACPKIDMLFNESLDPVKFQQVCKETFSEDMDKAAQLFEDAGLEVEKVILTGDPGDMVVDYANDQKVDKIIMGNRGMGALKSLILGSVAYKVLGKVKVPVTIVK